MKEKIDIDKLKPGMFVCGLDRPWLETPYPLQGFYINTPDQIKELHTHCKFVFVDSDKDKYNRSDSIKLHSLGADELNIKPVVYPNNSTVEAEFSEAENLRKETTFLIKELMTDVNNNRILNIEKINTHITSLIESIIREPNALMLLTKLRSKDPFIYRHAINVCTYMLAFGRHLGFPKDQLALLGTSGMLLDAGTMKIPSEILAKAPELTEEESIIYQSHVNLGLEILRKTPGISPTVLTILERHHERNNGSGYPNGLKRGDIGILAEIAGIADTFDAMTIQRKTSAGVSAYKVLHDLYEQRDKAFRMEVVEQFIQVIGVYPVGSIVELNSSEIAIVIELNKIRRLKPKVLVILDSDRKPVDTNDVINLLHDPKTIDNQTYQILKTVEPTEYDIDLNQYFIA